MQFSPSSTGTGVRSRPPDRPMRLIDAARGLATETGSAAFTVQQVVARSGLSLKSFYRHFDGKDALLLALIEADCRAGAEVLAARLDEQPTPLARVRAWVAGMFDLMASGEEGYVSVLVREHRRLAEAHPAAIQVALGPLTELLVTDLQAAMAAGALRPGVPARDARSILELVLLSIHELLLAGRSATDVTAAATYVWDFCWGGLQPHPPTGEPR